MPQHLAGTIVNIGRMLREKMDSYVSGGIAVAFSGGVDSALLLKLACMAAGENTVYAVTVRS